MSNSALDAGIPVLTEIIGSRPPEAPLQSHQTNKIPDRPGVADVLTVDGWLTEEWDRLERKIGGRILHQVMERLEADIEKRVRDALADVLQLAVEPLANDIKQNLHDSLQAIITQAVKAEISNMQSTKK